MPEKSDLPQQPEIPSHLLAARIGLPSELQFHLAVDEERERRRALEEERFARQEARERRAQDLVLGTLGTLGGLASVVGLAASVALGPALVPALIVVFTALAPKLRSLFDSWQTPPEPPPVFSSLSADLTRNREAIRNFTLRPMALSERAHDGD